PLSVWAFPVRKYFTSFLPPDNPIWILLIVASCRPSCCQSVGCPMTWVSMTYCARSLLLNRFFLLAGTLGSLSRKAASSYIRLAYSVIVMMGCSFNVFLIPV